MIETSGNSGAETSGWFDASDIIEDIGKFGEVDLLDDEGSSPLLVASGYGDEQSVRGLLRAGANPNLRNSSGWTPLMAAAYEGHAQICRWLIDFGAQVDIQKLDGWTALMGAVHWGHCDVVGILINAGADPAKQAFDGSSATSLAACCGIPEIGKRIKLRLCNIALCR